MGRKSRFTPKQKIEACEKYIKGHGSICSISDELGIAYESFRRWLLKYKNKAQLSTLINYALNTKLNLLTNVKRFIKNCFTFLFGSNELDFTVNN